MVARTKEPSYDVGANPLWLPLMPTNYANPTILPTLKSTIK
jgi:hypothetical protein